MKTISSFPRSRFAKYNAAVLAAAFALVIGASAADDEKSSDSASADTEKGTGTVEVANHTFKYAKPWAEKQVTSPMRAAELTYDHEEDELDDVSVAFFHMGGSIRQNLDRWIGQFAGEPKVEEEEMEFDGTKVVMLIATGTYNESSGGPFSGNSTPRKNYTMLGAVVETDNAARFVFLKLAGPNASVAAMKEEFKQLLTSPFAKK